tara:strand:+ start:774 stop:1217 length:444 start_codon:yes stop_codon:yes gene_type:complete
VTGAETINGKAIKGQPVCGVVAVAHVTGRDPEKVFKGFKKTLKMADNWRGGTYTWQVKQMLDQYRYKYEVSTEGRGTLAKWVEWYAMPGVSYIVQSGYHWQAVRDGIVTDQTGSHPIADYWGRRKHFKKAIKILTNRGTRKKSEVKK